MPETLLSESSVWLFGRILDDIRLAPPEVLREVYRGGPETEAEAEAAGRRSRRRRASRAEAAADPAYPQEPRRLSANSFLLRQLQSPDARIARIYSFSYQNELVELTKPALFVVNGDGVDPDAPAAGDARVDRRPSDPDRTGLGGQFDDFADEMRAWLYDRDDLTVRLDVMTGTLDRILLAMELETGGLDEYVRGGGASASPPSLRRRGRGGLGRRWRSDDE